MRPRFFTQREEKKGLVLTIPEWAGAFDRDFVFCVQLCRCKTVYDCRNGIWHYPYFIFRHVYSVGYRADQSGILHEFCAKRYVYAVNEDIAFCGFEVVATLVEESKKPEKDIQKALIGLVPVLPLLDVEQYKS